MRTLSSDWQALGMLIDGATRRAIANTLNTQYSPGSYSGLGNGATRDPGSAFITDLVYLKEAQVDVDVAAITVSTSSCTFPSLTSPSVFGCPLYAHRGCFVQRRLGQRRDR